MSGPAMEALFRGLQESPLTYLLMLVLVALAMKLLGLNEILLGKFGIKFGQQPKRSPMSYVRAMLNADRQKHAVDKKYHAEARRRTKEMIQVIISHVIAVEMIEIRKHVEDADSRIRDLSFRSLLRGEIKDEIMAKTMEIYELNGLGEYSESELTAKINFDFRQLVMSCADIARDGWANIDFSWDRMYETLAEPEHKAAIKGAFDACIKRFRDLSLQKLTEYSRINDLIRAIEVAADKHTELPVGCFDEVGH